MEAQYRSINRGGQSIFEIVRKAGVSLGLVPISPHSLLMSPCAPTVRPRAIHLLLESEVV